MTTSGTAPQTKTIQVTKNSEEASYRETIRNMRSFKGWHNAERMQQAVGELEYLVTFNWSISQVIARTMQDLSEGVFISVTNFTLAHRQLPGIFTNWCEARYTHCTTHCSSRSSPFSRTSVSLKLRKRFLEVRRGVLLASHTGNMVISIHVLPMTNLINRTRSCLSQLGIKYVNASRERKVVASLKLSHRNRPKVPNIVNDNYCVKCVTRLTDCVCVPSHRG